MTESDTNQDEEYSVHWVEDIVNEVLARDVDEYRISSGKSTSGAIHIGFVRELVIGDVIKRELQRLGKKAKTMFVVDDFDPLRSLPPGMNLTEDALGIPYSDLPDHSGCCESLGAHWAKELIDTFDAFGLDPEVFWQSKLYDTSEMLDAVRICLRETETIREIMVKYVAGGFTPDQRDEYIESMDSWYPASVICPVCGRLQAGGKGSIVPNRVTGYDSETDMVTYQCHACGHSATSPLSETRVKLAWRIDWVAKWYVLNVTCEPAGKDHAVKGGSYDTGLEISQRVFDWQGPVKVPFEWIRIGGRDMSSSEGIVLTPKEFLKFAPPELFRFIVLRTDPNRAYNIQPDRIPDLIDEFERLERVFYGIEAATEEQRTLAKLMYPLCVSSPVSDRYVPKLSFRFSVPTSQMIDLLGEAVVMDRCKEMLRKQYGLEEIPEEAMRLVPPRLTRARNWALMFGSERDRIEVPDEVPAEIVSTLTDEDKMFLSRFNEVLKQGNLDDEELQGAVFEKAREVGLKEKRAFVVLYRITISRKSGPRLGPFLNLLGNEWVSSRIESVLEG
jgi:lysyl-tRNA synthetase class 1